MAECVILFRYPNNRIGCVTDHRNEIEIFKNRRAAMKAALNTTVCKAFPYQIIEVDKI